jgi:membrane protease YdiL (CAAX protease family)
MSGSEVSGKKVGWLRQWSLCIIMVTIAWLICVARSVPFTGLFQGPVSLVLQSWVAVGLGLAAGLNAWVSYKLFARYSTSQHVIESYSRLDLHGWNPVLIALAAGLGEEILFRGVLQPLAGIGVSSLLFVLAHTRAYRFNTINRRVVLQAIGILAVSLVLGGVAHYAGLLPAIALHAAIDIGGLLTVRHYATCLAQRRPAEPATLHG